MRTRELIKLMPTQYRRTTDNPLYSGHFIPLLGYWTEDEGYVSKSTLEYNDEVLACPIIAIVETKLGNKDLELTITGKNAVYDHDTSEVQGSHTLTRKHFIDAGTTTETLFTVPRFTRPHATFLLTGLGNKIWDIESITTSVTINVGKINFYALASNGSRIIYWFGMWKIAEELKEMVRYWIAPTKCNRCFGTGLEPDSNEDLCLQCGGYKYSGYSTTKYVQRNIGYDVGLSRDFLNWGAMTDDEHEIVRKFINKAWTQKWWVTPTKKEIRRLFAHFYNLPEANIFITERFNLQEPVWTITLPEAGSVASPFGRMDESDRSLMKYIAESVTPAGVSVFVGFYTEYWFGDMETFSDRIHVTEYNQLASSLTTEYSLWGHGRWDFYNGWTIASEDFEGGSLDWTTNGTVTIEKVNDMNRHMARLEDNSYIATGQTSSNGTIELWVHPAETDLRIGMRDGSQWLWYIDYDVELSGWYDNDINLLTKALPNNDFHLSVYYDDSAQKYDVVIQQDFRATQIDYLNAGSTSELRIESIGTGYGFVDGIGLPDDGGYQVGDNWQRLHPFGWGAGNLDSATGISGTVYDLMEKYFRRNRFFDVNIL